MSDQKHTFRDIFDGADFLIDGRAYIVTRGFRENTPSWRIEKVPCQYLEKGAVKDVIFGDTREQAADILNGMTEETGEDYS